MLGTREYTLCSPFRANAHNSSYSTVNGLSDECQLADCQLCCYTDMAMGSNTKVFVFEII